MEVGLSKYTFACEFRFRVNMEEEGVKFRIM